MKSESPVLNVVRAMRFFLGEDRQRYLVHVPIVLISETGELIPPLLAGVLVNNLLVYKVGDSLCTISLIILALAASRGVVAWLRLRSKRVLGQIALNCRRRARIWGFERLVSFSMAWHQRESAGNKIQRLITGADSVRDWGNFHNDIASPLSSMVGVIVASTFISPYFSIFGLYFFGGMLVVELIYDKRISNISVKINSGIEASSGSIVEGTTNILTIKASGAGEMVQGAMAERERAATALAHERVLLSTQKWLIFQIHTAIAFGVFLAAITWASLHNIIAIGFVVTYIQYFNGLRSAANSFTEKLQTMVERYADLMRLMPIFDEEVGVSSKRIRDFPSKWHAIKIRELSFFWGEKLALSNVNLIFRRGDRIGIIGESGSGKSSLIKLILGLYKPSSGSIEIDDVPSNEIHPEQFERHIAVVLQDVELFNMSLRDNITLMRDTDENVFNMVCEAADLFPLINKLKDGAATILGERGLSLSGGERQRVGIARALCRAPDVLVLDEATSALDDETEDKVMRGILKYLRPDSILIAVAHRTRSLREMTEIINFRDGKPYISKSYMAPISENCSA
jgi:ABC-type multidrug transport system fused ATPase/permease subunit